MKLKKRIASVFLVLVMAMSLLAGCGGSDDGKETTTSIVPRSFSILSIE